MFYMDYLESGAHFRRAAVDIRQPPRIMPAKAAIV
jgi:hypothetical protein